MDSPTQPTPPDPAVTAAAQAKMNKETAVAQYGLAATNQNTPQGTLSYKQIGTWADGTPRFESTQAYSPGEQAIYDQNQQLRGNLGRIGVEQSSKVRELLGTPFQVDPGESIDGRLMEMGRQRLDPMIAQRSQALETDLINRGIRPGSNAYSRARGDFDKSRNDAYNQLMLSGRGQAMSEQQASIDRQLANRNQPLNEISALLSGSPVGQPNFRGTPTPGVAPTDYLGAVGQNMAQQNANYQAQMSQKNAMMSGLFGLGKTMMGMPFSGMAPFAGWG